MKTFEEQAKADAIRMAQSSAHYGNALAQSNIDQSYGRPKYGNDYLDPDRPLTGRAGDYLTGYEGSRCDRIDVTCRAIPDHICGICYHDKSEAGTCSREFCPEHKHHDLTGVDLDEFSKFCEEIGE